LRYCSRPPRRHGPPRLPSLAFLRLQGLLCCEISLHATRSAMEGACPAVVGPLAASGETLRSSGSLPTCRTKGVVPHAVFSVSCMPDSVVSVQGLHCLPGFPLAAALFPFGPLTVSSSFFSSYYGHAACF
jgi:hypothetical protein